MRPAQSRPEKAPVVAPEERPVALDNTVRRGTIVGGNLTGSGSFLIEGKVEGSVFAGGPVVVREGATVEGNIRAPRIVVLGCVRGDIHTEGALELGPAAQIVGEIQAREVGPLVTSVGDSPPPSRPFAVGEAPPPPSHRNTVVPPSAVPPPHWSSALAERGKEAARAKPTETVTATATETAPATASEIAVGTVTPKQSERPRHRKRGRK